jgi:hypothetical protein
MSHEQVHRRHDFGAFKHNGKRVFWKFDHYVPGLEHGSENSAEPQQTVPALTVMLAAEFC